MEEDQPVLDLHTATVRELLVELQCVESAREKADSFRLRSWERALSAELGLRRMQG